MTKVTPKERKANFAEKRVGHRFQPGNKHAVGNPGPRGRPVTQVILAKLSEVNKNTSKEYIYDLVDELFEQALPSFIEVMKRGKKVKVRVPGSLQAIQEIIKRSDGNPIGGISASADDKTGKVTIIFDRDDADA